MGGIHHKPSSKDNKTQIHVLQAFGGGLAGGVMRSLTHPLDVLKMRMQVQAGLYAMRKYRGVLHGISRMYVEEGSQGLMRGHNMSQVMGIIQGLVQFWTYEQLSLLTRKASFLRDHIFLRHFLCGGIAGCCSCAASYPFDIVRTQVMATENVIHRTMVQGFRHVYGMNGWNGFTRGLSFALLETFPLMGLKFLFYKYLNALTQAMQQKKKHEIHGGSLLVNAAVAGGIAKVVVYPVDLVKKRLQMETFKKDLKGSCCQIDCPTLQRCIATTLQYEGVRGFYKGLAPTVVRSMLANAIYFSVYDLFSRQFIDPLLPSDHS
ncbi:hypothetical protein KR032_009578 [Drosophila birchii]|nr:hypothetical protein KR032_009578 [Drosophila birchii]